MVDLEAVGIRSYIAEPDRGRRDWSQEPEAQASVYRNRRRIRGARGRRLMRQRGERIERSFAHLYDTGGMRRTHLRGHENILKRVLIHAGAFNLGLLIRSMLGVGTPRGLQGRLAAVIAMVLAFISATQRRWTEITVRVIEAIRGLVTLVSTLVVNSSAPATLYDGVLSLVPMNPAMSHRAARAPGNAGIVTRGAAEERPQCGLGKPRNCRRELSASWRLPQGSVLRLDLARPQRFHGTRLT